ncbi:hypothetical protein DV736_g276, partial [Chaetothyriales sp. CBS 134916]
MGKTTTDEVSITEPTSPKSSYDCNPKSGENAVVEVEKGKLEKQASRTQIDVDPNIVDWDGPLDPQNPMNWTNRKKYANVLMVSAFTLFTPFGSSILSPSVPQLMEEFHSNNVDLSSFVVSVWVLGYAFGPLVIAPMSELYGRLWVYHVNTLLFIVFCVACALSTSLSMEIVFRFLAGFAGVTPMTIGSGTIADLFKQEERGKVMAIWTLPILFGPCLGPIVGSYLGEAAGWRWDFWFLVIAGCVVISAAWLIQSETYAPTLLARKTERLKKKTGNMDLRSVHQSHRSPGDLFLLSIIRPTKMLFFSPIVFGLSLYIAICYGYLYLVFTTMPEIFESQYDFSHSSVGLTFLGQGAGQFMGLIGFGLVSDSMLKKAAANGGEMKPEYRLDPLMIGAITMPVGLLIYGWTAEYHVHWIVPIIGTALIGLSMILVFMAIGTYLVDAYTRYAASAIAANTVLRSLGGGLLPLAGYVVLNVIRGLNLTALLAVMAASSVMLVKTFIVSKFFFFDAAGHVVRIVISGFLILTELPLFKSYFYRNWPLFSPRSGFVMLGLSMIGLGNSILGQLNKEATSQKSLGLPFWRIVIAAGVIVLVMGFVNIFASYIFRDTKTHLTARQVRSHGAVAFHKADVEADPRTPNPNRRTRYRSFFLGQKRTSLPSYYSHSRSNTGEKGYYISSPIQNHSPRSPGAASSKYSQGSPSPRGDRREGYGGLGSPPVVRPDLAHHPAMTTGQAI